MRRLLLISLLLLSLPVWAGTCGNGYSFSVALVVDHNIIPSTLTNKPWAFCFNGACTTSITLPWLKTVANSGGVNNLANNSAGISTPADAIVCDAAINGNAVKYDFRPGYDAATGAAIIDVQEASLSSSTDTVKWLFIGKVSVVTTQQDLTLWTDANYLVVCMYGTSSTLSYACYVGGTGTAVNTPTAAAGQVGGGIALASASSQAVNMGTPSGTDLTGGGSIEVWGLYSSASLQAMVSKQDSGSSNGGGCALYSGDNTSANITFQCSNGSGTALVRTSGNRSSGWHYMVGTTTNLPTSTSAMKIYDQGVAQSTPTTIFNATGISASGQNLNIGRFPAGTAFYTNGTLDEVRMNSTVLSADWITATYRNELMLAGSSIVLDANTPTGLAAGANCVARTIQNTYVPNTNRTNYQLLLHGYWWWMADITHGGYAVNGNSGHDIRLYSNNTCTSALNFERVYWSNTTGQALFRVLVPTVLTASTTTVYVKIGSPSDTSDLSSATNTWPSGWVGVYEWGSPTSLGLVSSGTDGITLTSTGSSVPSLGPMGPAAYVPNDGASTIGFTALNADTISSRGYVITSGAPRHMACWFKNDYNSNARCTANGGDCTIMSTGKANAAGDGGAFQTMWNNGTTQLLGMPSNPGFQTATGAQIAASTATSNVFLASTNYSWTKFDVDYATPGAATSTMVLNVNGTTVTTPFTLNPASVINTANGSTFGVDQAEVRFARDAGHGVGFYTGQIGLCTYTSTSLGADEVQTRYNNEVTPFLFSLWGASSPVSSGANRRRVTTYQ
jgi:hypothetical protein